MSATQKWLLLGSVVLMAIGLGMKVNQLNRPIGVIHLPPASVTDTLTAFEFQVTKPVLAKEGNPAPHYPRDLQSARFGGEVLVQFVVDTTGVVDMRTFKVLKSSDERFSESIREVLPRYRFTPAEKDGKVVRQWVQLPFVFQAPRF
jgi:TonB family protein